MSDEDIDEILKKGLKNKYGKSYGRVKETRKKAKKLFYYRVLTEPVDQINQLRNQKIEAIIQDETYTRTPLPESIINDLDDELEHIEKSEIEEKVEKYLEYPIPRQGFRDDLKKQLLNEDTREIREISEITENEEATIEATVTGKARSRKNRSGLLADRTASRKYIDLRTDKDPELNKNKSYRFEDIRLEKNNRERTFYIREETRVTELDQYIKPHGIGDADAEGIFTKIDYSSKFDICRDCYRKNGCKFHNSEKTTGGCIIAHIDDGVDVNKVRLDTKIITDLLDITYSRFNQDPDRYIKKAKKEVLGKYYTVTGQYGDGESKYSYDGLLAGKIHRGDGQPAVENPVEKKDEISPAVRVFIHELNNIDDKKYSRANKDGKNFCELPTGLEVNRVFFAGVITKLTKKVDTVKAAVTDITGSRTEILIPKHQEKLRKSFPDSIDIPSYVGVIAKPQQQRELMVENIFPIDSTTHFKWIDETVVRTKIREKNLETSENYMLQNIDRKETDTPVWSSIQDKMNSKNKPDSPENSVEFIY